MLLIDCVLMDKMMRVFFKKYYLIASVNVGELAIDKRLDLKICK
jgi:hypothetical protein